MPDYDQGYQVGAKFGTVFFGESATGDWTELVQDLSQEQEDLADAGTSGQAENDARFDRPAPRTIHVRASVANTSSGTLFAKGAPPPDAPDLHFHIDAGVITIEIDGSAVGSLSPVLTGTEVAHQIAWVTEVNPDSTAPADAELSWILSYNEGTDVASRAGPFPHAAAASNDDVAVFGAVDLDGNETYSGTITLAGFHQRAMTLREIYNDHVAAAGTLLTTVELGREPLPLTLASGAGNQDECYGPTHAWAAANARGLRRRLVTARAARFASLLLSTTYGSATAVPWVRTVPQTVYRSNLGHLLAVPAPIDCTHLWVRVHSRIWVAGGSSVPVGLRCYAANRPPVLADELGAEPLASTYVEEVLTRNDGVFGSGEWTTLGLLPITRGTSSDRADWTYVFLAWAIDPANASGNDAACRLMLNALVVVPCES